ncbi:MAG: Gfo/Idh/MocA family oxidoreductase [Pirellulales bacterium]
MGHLSRRRFLSRSVQASAALSIGYFAFPSSVTAAPGPNDKLRLACVGVTGRAGENIRECSEHDIVALADVDQNLLDKGAAAYPQARKYADYRVMLEKEAPQIDAVLVGTPDHNHAPATAMAMRLGKHAYCEKPLTHTVLEARTLANLARDNKLVTQMGTQIHAGDNYRRVVELIRGGAIGPVSEVHVWVGVDYSGAKFDYSEPAPQGLDWDLWLGPTPSRPYSKGVHPFQWRRFWDFGAGGLGDFGCHYLDLVHWALDLQAPTTIEAEGPPVDPVSCPPWVKVHYEYPARGAAPPVRVHWYDGGRKPELLSTVKLADGQPLDWGSGQLFVGRDGMLVSDYGRHLLLPADKFADYRRPEPTIPTSVGHHREWIDAIRAGGGPTTCNFAYSGALTEAVLLGTVAYRSGQRIEWDAAQLQVTNSPQAQALLHTEYRPGWTL